MVTLKLEKNPHCSDCKSRCSNGFLSFLFHKKDKDVFNVALKNQGTHESHNTHFKDEQGFFNESFKINETIGIKFNESHLFKMSFILYGLPILLIITLLIVGYYSMSYLQYNPDIGGVVGLFTGLFVAKGVISQISKKNKTKVTFFK